MREHDISDFATTDEQVRRVNEWARHIHVKPALRKIEAERAALAAERDRWKRAALAAERDRWKRAALAYPQEQEYEDAWADLVAHGDHDPTGDTTS